MKKIKSPRDYMLYLLGRREYSVSEMREKLLKKFPEEFSDVKKLIQNFVQKDWLSDKRFVEFFIRDQKIKKIGPLKIVEKLWMKGISKSFAQDSLEMFYLKEEQEKIIIYLIEKKRRLLENKNFKIAGRFKKKDSSQAQNDCKYFLESEENKKISDFEINQKIKNYILGRGFGFDLINKFLNKE